MGWLWPSNRESVYSQNSRTCYHFRKKSLHKRQQKLRYGRSRTTLGERLWFSPVGSLPYQHIFLIAWWLGWVWWCWCFAWWHACLGISTCRALVVATIGWTRKGIDRTPIGSLTPRTMLVVATAGMIMFFYLSTKYSYWKWGVFGIFFFLSSPKYSSFIGIYLKIGVLQCHLLRVQYCPLSGLLNTVCLQEDTFFSIFLIISYSENAMSVFSFALHIFWPNTTGCGGPHVTCTEIIQYMWYAINILFYIRADSNVIEALTTKVLLLI